MNDARQWRAKTAARQCKPKSWTSQPACRGPFLFPENINEKDESVNTHTSGAEESPYDDGYWSSVESDATPADNVIRAAGRWSPKAKRDRSGGLSIEIVGATPDAHHPAPVIEVVQEAPLSMADFCGRAPEREWTVKDWIPSGVVTGLYGDGGVGKTFLALQLQASMALGRKWLGVEVEKGRSLGVYCEDDEDELHRRRDDINEAMDCETEDLRDAELWPRFGKDNILMTFDRRGKGETTRFHKELLERAVDGRFRSVVFDTASDGFAGNENDRGQVKQFVNIGLGAIARAIGGSVILCAHPSRSGIASGRGDSGSTGWNNAFRSRLYVDIARGEGGEADLASPDVRTLERMKANYAQRGEVLNLRWRNGVIVRERDPNEATPGQRRSCSEVFLSLLDKREAQGCPVSDKSRASNYAPKEFAMLPSKERDGYDKAQLGRAMAALFSSGSLAMETYQSNGKPCQKIAIPTVATVLDGSEPSEGLSL